ncbi:beta strand repeat-containing protein [Burkholderia guangdongensis]|uniref:beta strand repeat-containing protein n=1 Tax=Burkholderia guangdongensis TaxID=1792500 RepID=UPI0015C9896C|nr:filamentous hemagglutinin N-terminal domain-containing protein [Burkholderia guangdongensis]
MKKPVSARSRHAGAIASAVAALFAASVATPSCANPTGAQVVSGSVSVSSPAAGQMNITQGTPNAIVNWNTFSIGANEAVTIAQPSASAALLNRVLGNDESVIAGRLQANGRVFLVNPAGVIFAPGSSVNVGSMIASTLDISDADFLAGHFRFVGTSAAPVGNAGTLTARDGGTIALLGGTVSNTGTVSARLGTVALGAGSDVTVDFAGDGLTTLQINQGAAHALVGNAGTLAADGGTVVMSAQTADALAGTVLNQQGIVRAQSLAERDGHIFLDGGSNGITQVSGTLDATGGAGLTGGRIDVTGHDVALLAGANVDASGAAGGGTVRFGGGAAGADPTIRDADALWMSPDASIHADALANGNGGHIVAYGDSVARLYGTFSAKGGPQGGNGGLIETSSHSLDTAGAVVDASALHGVGGTWLLDPYSVTIVSSGPAAAASDAPGGSVTFSYSSASTLTTGAIQSELNNGTSVTVATSATGGNGAGDIDVADSATIQKTSGGDAKFSLQASGSVVIGYGVSITSSAGKLDVLLDSNVGVTAPFGGTVSIGDGFFGGATIQTNGGNFVVNGNGGSGAASITRTTVDTGGGNVSITGNVGSGGTVATSTSSASALVGGVVIDGSTFTTHGGSVQFSADVNSPNVAIAYATTIATGAIVTANNSAISTQGGSVTIGGKLESAISVQTSGFVPTTSNGVDLEQTTITTAGGGLSITGDVTGNSATSTALNLGTTSIGTGGGMVTLDGIAGSVALSNSPITTQGGNLQITGSGTSADGVSIFSSPIDTTSSATQGGGVSIDGTTNSAFSNGVSLSGTVTTASGAISMTGTQNVPSTGLEGSNGTGINLNGASLTTTSGPISLTGIVNTTVQVFYNNTGLAINTGSTITSSSGSISLTGTTNGDPTNPNASMVGVAIEGNTDGGGNPSSVTTGSGTLSIYGSGVGTQTEGVIVADGSGITSTNGGNIDIRGAVAGPPAIAGQSNVQNDFGVLVLNGGVLSSGTKGDIAITGSTNTSDPGVAIGYVLPATSFGSVAGPVTITSTNPGTVTLRSANDGTTDSLAIVSFDGSPVFFSSNGTLVIAPAAVDAANGYAVTPVDSTPITLLGTGAGLSIDPTTFQMFSGFQSMIFGSTSQTGLITVNGVCGPNAAACVLTKPSFTTNLTLSNPGAGSQGIVLPYGISMPGYTLTLASAGPVTDPGGIQAAGLLLAGPGTFTLTDPQNDVGVLAMANAGTVNFLNSVGFAIGPIISKTYSSTTGQLATIDATNSTLTGNLVATAATGGISLGGGTATSNGTNGPTGGLNTNLTAGGSADLVMENGVFTDAGTGTISAGNAWRIWAQTWNGETRGNVQPNTTQPNFYGCLFGAGCSWGGTVPTTGDHYVYAARPTVTITANDATRTALTPNPPFTYTASGLINGDTTATLTGGLTTPATQTSPIGTYPIDPNFASSVGYIVNQVPGTLTVLPVAYTWSTLASGVLQAFFGHDEQTFVYENNLQGTNICIGSTQPLFTTAVPGQQQDLLAVEWKRVRQQPNLNSCLITNGEHGCGDF